MKDSAVSERLCVEELKATLKLGKEVKTLKEKSNELSQDLYFAQPPETQVTSNQQWVIMKRERACLP